MPNAKRDCSGGMMDPSESGTSHDVSIVIMEGETFDMDSDEDMTMKKPSWLRQSLRFVF